MLLTALRVDQHQLAPLVFLPVRIEIGHKGHAARARGRHTGLAEGIEMPRVERARRIVGEVALEAVEPHEQMTIQE